MAEEDLKDYQEAQSNRDWQTHRTPAQPGDTRPEDSGR